ncbi:MAG: type II secretion system protein GspN [Nitrospiraceae bacterium]
MMTRFLLSPGAKIIGAWGLFVSLALLASLAISFPYEALQARLLSEVSTRSGVAITAERWSVAWPLGLEWRHVTFSVPQVGRLEAERVRVTLNVLRSLWGRLVIDVKASVSNGSPPTPGQLTARLILGSWFMNGPGSMSGAVEQVDLPAFAGSLMKRGRLRAEFDQRWNDVASADTFLGADGKLRIELVDLQIDPLSMQPALPAVSFAMMKTVLQCKDALCHINEFLGDGSDGSFSGTGQLALRRPMDASVLTLTVAVSPSASFAQRASSLGVPIGSSGAPMTFMLRGPIAKPLVSFS